MSAVNEQLFANMFTVTTSWGDNVSVLIACCAALSGQKTYECSFKVYFC